MQYHQATFEESKIICLKVVEAEEETEPEAMTLGLWGTLARHQSGPRTLRDAWLTSSPTPVSLTCCRLKQVHLHLLLHARHCRVNQLLLGAQVEGSLV
jgi:hypothetical protein